MTSPNVSTIQKTIPTLSAKIEAIEVFDFRIEPIPGGKAQLIRPGKPTETGPEDEIREKARALVETQYRVSARGFAPTVHTSEDLARKAAAAVESASAVTYTSRLLPASVGLRIVPKLIALFGPALTAFFVSDIDASELRKDPKILAGIVSRVAQNAAESDGLEVLRELMIGLHADKVRIGDVTCPGSVEENFDLHFAGRFGHLVEVALWIAEENFIGS